MTEPGKIWYAYSGTKYSGSLPDYFDPGSIDGLQEVKRRHDDLLKELNDIINGNPEDLHPYFNTLLVKGEWEILSLIDWGRPNERLLSKFPLLAEILQRIPGITSAAISRLQSGSEILPHIGDTNAIVRCHYGLKIPASLPDCGLMVNSVKREWKTGEWITFCDAYEHSAWNHSPASRIVLIVDVLLPEYRSQKLVVCSNVKSMLMLQAEEQRNPLIKWLPGKVRGLIRRKYARRILKELNSPTP